MVRGHSFSKTCLLVILLNLSSVVLAENETCKGYEVEVVSIKPCKETEDYVILVDRNSTIKLSEECLAYPTVRSVWGPFETANVKYLITKHNGSQMKGSYNLCDGDHPSLLAQFLKVLGLPTSCPVSEGYVELDGTKGISVAKYKMLMSMFKGLTKMKVNVEHENNKRSCMIVTVNLKVNEKAKDDVKK